MNRLVKLAGLLAVAPLIALASDDIATLRGGAINQEAQAPAINRVVNSDIKLKRNYPMQPPLIPHTIDGYQVDLKANKCMACHSRRLTEESQAPMISVTHYMDRDANFLAEISPRRYFCEQCHVVQTNARPLLGNDFVDIDSMLHKDRDSTH
jgi:cytochrome c-type protein NapB